MCRKDGRGLVEYEWPRAAGGDPVPKFSVRDPRSVLGLGRWIRRLRGRRREPAAQSPAFGLRGSDSHRRRRRCCSGCGTSDRSLVRPLRRAGGAVCRRREPGEFRGAGSLDRLFGAVARLDLAGRLARRDVGFHGGDGVDDPQERRELRAGRRTGPGIRPPRQRCERGARQPGRLDDRHSRIQRQGHEDRQDHRRDRLPDQHPGPQRRRRSRPGRRSGHGLRRRRRRSAQPGAALRPGRQGHGRTRSKSPRHGRGRGRQGGRGRAER